jgi:hypothetical protein
MASTAKPRPNRSTAEDQALGLYSKMLQDTGAAAANILNLSAIALASRDLNVNRVRHRRLCKLATHHVNALRRFRVQFLELLAETEPETKD